MPLTDFEKELVAEQSKVAVERSYDLSTSNNEWKKGFYTICSLLTRLRDTTLTLEERNALIDAGMTMAKRICEKHVVIVVPADLAETIKDKTKEYEIYGTN
jgi:hypothetical protein